ncbi:hypothetical protein [Modestobacter sp. VKM Ac-2984]|uniref:hypothetical protein n=1 Tax=Modestobacter sp. VKM Ac-2984 TaxID=3004138 RepID=UPI0022AAAAA2|nr:hypothetical protein [Modestobacter sp. VKM Ac-2984]MCZ2817268.1 hypothetical protein [Modestobacter sp. VKM Ac-2984]
MSVAQLKQAVNAVAKEARTLGETLNQFHKANRASLSDAKAALNGTGQNVATDVAAALDEASEKIKSARDALAEAERAAKDYAAKL